MQLHKFLVTLSLLLLTNCIVFETIDKLPEPMVHLVMVPLTMGLPILLVP